MPANDWQFWVVTLLAIGALALVAWPLLAIRRSRGSCCRGGAGTSRAGPTRTKLTISAGHDTKHDD